jgi:lactoylglutathione lyase
MVPVRDLFEGHLTVSDLSRSMTFFSEVLGLELAHVVAERRVAFYWIGGRGNAMLGLWEVGAVPQRLNLHLAFRTDLDDLLQAPARLRRAGVTPLDFSGNPTDEPVVLAWMPAASLYFNDPDGNLLEYLSMLPEPPEPALGVVEWTRWTHRHTQTAHRLDPLAPEAEPTLPPSTTVAG